MTQDQIERTAMLAAAKAATRLDVPKGRWVDVFAALRQSEALVMFQPLASLSGGYLRGDDIATGVIINSLHPLSRQRMSAAHELGHLVFKHESTIDLAAGEGFEPVIAGRSEAEKLAESFARWFLMPHHLIDAGLASLGIENLSTEQDVYRLSLFMGTSYDATARQVVHAKRASYAKSQTWIRKKPVHTKRALCDGFALRDARNDVHVLDLRESEGYRLARPFDLLVLHLPERPATGYRWALPERMFENFELKADDYINIPSGDERTGVVSTRRIALEVRDVESPRDIVLTAYNVRLWEPEKSVQSFILDVRIETLTRKGVAFAEDVLVAA